MIDMEISVVNEYQPANNNRFGTNLARQKEFIKDFLAMERNGYKVCDYLKFKWENTSPHADNFLWNVIAYRVSNLFIKLKSGL